MDAHDPDETIARDSTQPTAVPDPGLVTGVPPFEPDSPGEPWQPAERYGDPSSTGAPDGTTPVAHGSIDAPEWPVVGPPATTAGTPQSARLGYAVDIVFVIDITGSMQPVIDQVKAGALGFHEHLLNTMSSKDKYVSSLRLRVVAYRDYLDNASDALFHTPFFSLPGDLHAFDNYVQGLYADGGGDEPESGLEALAVACLSDWERGLDRRRHVIVLFSDASSHPLEAAAGQYIPGYPTVLPKTFDEMTDLWDDPQGATMEFSAKRLLIYAPDVYPWNVISSAWDNVLHFPSKAGRGLNEVQFGQIIDAIAGSV